MNTNHNDSDSNNKESLVEDNGEFNEDGLTKKERQKKVVEYVFLVYYVSIIFYYPTVKNVVIKINYVNTVIIKVNVNNVVVVHFVSTVKNDIDAKNVIQKDI